VKDEWVCGGMVQCVVRECAGTVVETSTTVDVVAVLRLTLGRVVEAAGTSVNGCNVQSRQHQQCLESRQHQLYSDPPKLCQVYC